MSPPEGDPVVFAQEFVNIIGMNTTHKAMMRGMNRFISESLNVSPFHVLNAFYTLESVAHFVEYPSVAH